MKSSKGLTFIELLLVVAIIAILGASTAPFLSQFLVRNQVEAASDQVIASLRKAQSYALNGRNDALWGVCIRNNNIQMYSGSCSSPLTSENFAIPASITISGLLDTTFSKMRGEPSQTLNISISSSLKSRTVILNSVGGMTIN